MSEETKMQAVFSLCPFFLEPIQYLNISIKKSIQYPCFILCFYFFNFLVFIWLLFVSGVCGCRAVRRSTRNSLGKRSLIFSLRAGVKVKGVLVIRVLHFHAGIISWCFTAFLYEFL